MYPMNGMVGFRRGGSRGSALFGVASVLMTMARITAATAAAARGKLVGNQSRPSRSAIIVD